MIKVLQIIDTLNAGGAERLAVNYANELNNRNIESHLCVTRKEGPLLQSLEEKVGFICLNRKSTLDFQAIFRLKNYISKHRINVLHAHSSSYFIAVLVKLFSRNLKIVWHDHYGNSEFLERRPKFVLRIFSLLFSQIFSVNTQLEEWARDNLLCKKVVYIKNFPVLKIKNNCLTQLKGVEGKRILCLANLREQKNHIKLLQAFKLIKDTQSEWTLHCVGKDFKDDYSISFFRELKRLNLQKNVFFYDTKSDILNILQQSSIGVLVSKSEGLPLALLEYGLAGLPVICTNVGSCGKLVPNSTYGILINDNNVHTIAQAMNKFIVDTNYRNSSARKFNSLILEEYSKDKVVNQIIATYKDIVSK